MATIYKRQNSDGTFSYRVNIRKKGIDICRTFYDEESANLYIFYKECLIANMKNFEVPLEERITVRQILKLKEESVEEINKRIKKDFSITEERLSLFLDLDKYAIQLTYDDWLQIAKNMATLEVYKGAKNEKGKRVISPTTIRRYFAIASSAYSHAISQGLNIENHPLKIIQSHITPLLKS